MRTELGLLVDLSHVDRLTLAVVFTMCADDCGHAVSTLLREWCDDLGRRQPVLYAAPLDRLTRQ